MSSSLTLSAVAIVTTLTSASLRCSGKRERQLPHSTVCAFQKQEPFSLGLD